MKRGLYAIVDVDTLARAGCAVSPFAERVLAAGELAAMQLRAKSLGGRAMLDIARSLSQMCARAGVPFYVNDRPDVALLAGATGVHVGTDDLPVREIRRFAAGLKVGASCHSDADVYDALESGADYLAFGPVAGTRSKADHAPVVGVEALRSVAARCASRGLPLVAIGGITLETAASIRDAGATAGAVISGLGVDIEGATERARALHLALGGA